MKNRSKKYISKQNRGYSPYCDLCTGCGEDGCCPATCCKMHPDGKYCERYLKDLQFGYLMYRDVYDLVDKEKMNPIWDKNYAIVYEREVDRKKLSEQLAELEISENIPSFNVKQNNL